MLEASSSVINAPLFSLTQTRGACEAEAIAETAGLFRVGKTEAAKNGVPISHSSMDADS